MLKHDDTAAKRFYI